jgi:hypothetical protein
VDLALLWVAADPRLPVDDLKTEYLEQTSQQQAIHSGNLSFLQKVKINPANDNILLLLDKLGWSPKPEVVEYLLTFKPDLSQKLEGQKHPRRILYSQPLLCFRLWRLET